MILLMLATLATYRLAALLAEEEGPFALAARWRSRFLVDDWLGRGVRCVGCVGFWLALPLSLAALVLDPALDPWAWPLVWLGVAGAARWLWRIER